MGTNFLARVCCERTRGNDCKVNDHIDTGEKEEISVVRVAQRDDRCCIPGNIPGRVAGGSEQPALFAYVPVEYREVGLFNL